MKKISISILLITLALLTSGCAKQDVKNANTNVQYSPFAAVVLKDDIRQYTNTTYDFSFTFPAAWSYEIAKSNSATQLLQLTRPDSAVSATTDDDALSLNSSEMTVRVFTKEKQPADYADAEKKLSTAPTATESAIPLATQSAAPLGTNVERVLQLNATTLLVFSSHVEDGADHDAIQQEMTDAMNSFRSPAAPVK